MFFTRSLFFLLWMSSASLIAQNLATSKDDSFITAEEYGKRLYENPRNIGCVKCHGKNGEGEVIARYKNKGKNKIITAPKINNMSFNSFQKAIGKEKGIMPKYNLTNEEIKAIYLYITSKNFQDIKQ